jgi:hypothetical protein
MLLLLNSKHSSYFKVLFNLLSELVFLLKIQDQYMNNNQHDALFIFCLLSYRTYTCFGYISSPTSGGRTYMLGKLYVFMS